MERYVRNDYEKKDLEEKLRMIESGEVSFSSWEEAEAQARLFQQARKYSFSTTNQDKISLHDCYLSNAELNGNRLTLYFDDGFMHADISDHWPNTENAKIDLLLSSESEAYLIFYETDDQTVFTKYTIRQVVDKINTKEWELEFYYEENEPQKFIHSCWIHTQNLRSFLSTLIIPIQEPPIFYWNTPKR